MVKMQRASRVRRFVSSVGLLPVAFVVWRTVRELSPRLLLQNRRLRRRQQNRIPIPPGHLIFSATGTRDVSWFLDSGVATAGAFRDGLDSVGRPLESFESVFELGCGCGRVLRQWLDVEGPRFQASDYNPAGVEWCHDNIGFVTVSTNKLEPPLQYATGSFDLCYAVSVFTHLSEELQEPWIRELHRVLRPGGVLLLTLSGEGDLVRTTPEEQDRFRAGELVIVDDAFAGTNLCGVYHPESYIRTHWSSLFKVRLFVREGALGVPKQDLYLLERT